MLTDSEFGKRLSSERKRLGLNQSQFADACGVKVASQFLYEKGARSPNSNYLIKAFSLGVDAEYLFGREKSPKVMNIDLSDDELDRIFIECDVQSRTHKGELLDLEHRLRKFNTLKEKYRNRKRKPEEKAG